MKTIAIDFETANEQRGSACSVGLAGIEGTQVVRVEERLIRPKDMRFSSFNIGIHGIRPEHVEDAPEFPEVMDEFADDFHGATMIAHNAAFDFSVWRSALDGYCLRYPDLSYLCSVKMAQRVWPQLISHKLNVLTQHLGLSFTHHNAAADAAMCAEASIAIARDLNLENILYIPERIGVKIGRLFSDGYSPCSCSRK
ncbi:3'-5' exonuclease [Rhizobium sp. P38BS-XIX]|uniref:3'-5' exonuclease n=1 Tax=Rhizobium sp. P38BS-XIX TaxID=2726740 RepID=UPI0014575C49|nr:3'-5' exonuclease [Rhizobium sp. P38BS-XIX]NLR97173.1 3'-5' exonuclease [Rhizobium sp. P38BS-XIX]